MKPMRGLQSAMLLYPTNKLKNQEIKAFEVYKEILKSSKCYKIPSLRCVTLCSTWIPQKYQYFSSESKEKQTWEKMNTEYEFMRCGLYCWKFK